jgi:hypothetical protein
MNHANFLRHATQFSFRLKRHAKMIRWDSKLDKHGLAPRGSWPGSQDVSNMTSVTDSSVSTKGLLTVSWIARKVQFPTSVYSVEIDSVISYIFRGRKSESGWCSFCKARGDSQAWVTMSVETSREELTELTRALTLRCATMSCTLFSLVSHSWQ